MGKSDERIRMGGEPGMISQEQQNVIDMIPTRQWRGEPRPVSDLMDVSRKLHHYRYNAHGLAIFAAEIEAWKDAEAKRIK